MPNVDKEAQKRYSSGNNVLTGSITLREAKPKLKAKETITLEGLGKVVSGLFFVEKVTHSFSRGGYTQSIDVSRDGFGTSIQLSKPDKSKKPADSKPTDRSHKIKKGDTLWWISDRYYGDPMKWKTIAKANNISWNKREEYRLQIGRTLKIP